MRNPYIPTVSPYRGVFMGMSKSRGLQPISVNPAGEVVTFIAAHDPEVRTVNQGFHGNAKSR